MKTYDQLTAIAENYVNGNISDFKKQLKKLSKNDLFQLLISCHQHLGATPIQAAELIQNSLL